MNCDEKIKEELSKFSSILNEKNEGEPNWFNIRNIENYTPEIREYPLLSQVKEGKRTVLVPKDLENNKNVQTTRTINVTKNLEKLKEDFKNSTKKGGNDITRIWELENFFASWSAFDKLRDKIEGIPDISPKGFCEIGFRNIKLMNHYGKKYDIPVCGYDICELSVHLANLNGYDGRYADLNRPEENNLDLSGFNVIASYHVLEHLVDPLQAIQKIYAAMDDLAIFHVEVPREEIPNYEYGHVFPFHHLDLEKFLVAVGFQIVGLTHHESQTVDGPYKYTRAIAMKGYEKIEEAYKKIRDSKLVRNYDYEQRGKNNG